MRLYRWTLWALAVTDLWVGALMFLAPAWFGQVAGFPVTDVPVMRGYGERIILLGLVYLWLLHTRGQAGRLRWLPLLDEALNTCGDAYDLLTGSISAAVVGPMLALHAAFALLLAVAACRAGGWREEVHTSVPSLPNSDNGVTTKEPLASSAAPAAEGVLLGDHGRRFRAE